jgi:ribosome-binding factor A
MARQRPKAPGQRQLRIGEEIRHVLAGILERETFRDPGLAGVSVTVTEVRPSPDLRHARVYIVPLGGGDPAPILAGLRRVKPFLRREMAGRLTMKFIPDLVFAADTTFDEAERIARLLHKPEVARDLGADFAPIADSSDRADRGEEE